MSGAHSYRYRIFDGDEQEEEAKSKGEVYVAPLDGLNYGGRGAGRGAASVAPDPPAVVPPGLRRRRK